MTHSLEMSTQDNSVRHTVYKCPHRIAAKPSFTRNRFTQNTESTLPRLSWTFLVIVVQQTNFCSPGRTPNVTSIVVEQRCFQTELRIAGNSNKIIYFRKITSPIYSTKLLQI